MDKQKFINLIKDGAIQAYKKYNILPSLIMAQAILESSWGEKAPGNMLFGIKWTKGCGYDSQILWTSEFIDGKIKKVKAKFRKYKNFTESIDDHAQLLLLSRYKPVRQAKDYKDACNKVQQCGYATDPKYAKKLISIIEASNLQQYDIQAAINNFETPKKGMLISSTLSCKEVPSNNAKTNGILRKGVHEPLTIYAECQNEGIRWYLVNKNTAQWIAAHYVQLV
jgi:flagellum-specific peptidoglycan hydrolase FlgJ